MKKINHFNAATSASTKPAQITGWTVRKLDFELANPALKAHFNRAERGAMNAQLFELGRLVMTPGALALRDAGEDFGPLVATRVRRLGRCFRRGQGRE